MDAARDTASLELLRNSGAPFVSLYHGRSASDLALWAPYLVHLPGKPELLAALLERGWTNAWASYCTSSKSPDELRHHFRKYLMVRLDDGREANFRFYDPRVMRDFLPTLPPADLPPFFGPVQAWIVEAKSGKAILHFEHKDGLNCIETPTGKPDVLPETKILDGRR